MNKIAKKPGYLTTAEGLKNVNVKVLFRKQKGNMQERETYLLIENLEEIKNRSEVVGNESFGGAGRTFISTATCELIHCYNFIVIHKCLLILLFP